MKRTGELVLGIIGIIINLIVGGLIAFATIGMQAGLGLVEGEMRQDLMNDPAISAQDADAIMGFMGMFGPIGWWIVIMHVVGLVLSIFALVKLNKSPKAAGILFLISGGAMLLLTLGTTLIQSVLFIIAGIMCLVRKPPQHTIPPEEPEQPQY